MEMLSIEFFMLVHSYYDMVLTSNELKVFPTWSQGHHTADSYLKDYLRLANLGHRIYSSNTNTTTVLLCNPLL